MLAGMRKAITLTLSIAFLGVFAAVVVAAMEPSDGTSTLPAPTTGTTESTETGIDIPGPCDEAEHANDPRCTGAQAPRPAPAPAPPAGVDIPGPCDEAEHASDPRCTGAGVPDEGGRLDNSGPGSANSGPGSVSSDDFDDHGGDDLADDSSGSGHGGGGNSGPGGGDD
jgi:hypothetical protein